MRDAISVANAESLQLSCACSPGGCLLSEQNYELVVCAAAMALHGGNSMFSAVATSCAKDAILSGNGVDRGVVSAFRPFARVSSPECSGCCFPWRH